MDSFDVEQIYKRSFSMFCRNVMGQLVAEFYIDITNHIDNQLKKKTNKTNLSIKVSRGHGKTITFSRSFPLWMLYRSSTPITIIIQSMNQDMSRKILGLSRDILTSNSYFKNFKFKKETDKLLEIYVPGHEGDDNYTHKLYSVPLGTRGLHGDVIILDDIQKDENGSSTTNLNHIKTLFWNATVPMSYAKNGLILFIGTPISHNDIFKDIEDIEANGGDWETFEYPIIIKDINDNDTPLFPEIYPMDKISRMESSMPSWTWQQEYMLRPVGKDSMFPLELIDSCVIDSKPELSDVDKSNEKFYTGCDVAMSSASTADYSAFITVSKSQSNGIIIENIWHERGVSEPEQILEIKRIKQLYNVTSGKIERKGLTYSMAGAIISDIELCGVFSDWNPTNDSKSEILGNLQLLMKHKMLKIPKNINHFEDLKNELISFGIINENGTQRYKAISGHDDLVIGLALAVASAGGWVFEDDYPPHLELI